MNAPLRWLCSLLFFALTFTLTAPPAHAFECPIRHKEARQEIAKARAASQQATDSAKLANIEELLDQAEESLRNSETTHFGAKNNADHATSVRLAYEAIGAAKEAYYLATK